MIYQIRQEKNLNNDLCIEKISYSDYCVVPSEIFMGTYQIIQIIRGYIECFNIDTNEITKYPRETACIFTDHTKYALKIKKGTIINRIIFAGCCKEIADIPFNIQYSNWIAEGIQPYRKDYFHDSLAPVPNSIRPAASAIILNDKGQILLLQRQDNKKWTIPGGTLEYNESVEQCLLREIKEETNLNVEIIKIFKIYSDPEAIIEYLDGEIRREFNIVFLVRILNGQVAIDEESSQYAWVDINKVHLLPLSPSQKRRIIDIQKLLQTSNFLA